MGHNCSCWCPGVSPSTTLTQYLLYHTSSLKNPSPWNWFTWDLKLTFNKRKMLSHLWVNFVVTKVISLSGSRSPLCMLFCYSLSQVLLTSPLCHCKEALSGILTISVHLDDDFPAHFMYFLQLRTQKIWPLQQNVKIFTLTSDNRLTSFTTSHDQEALSMTAFLFQYWGAACHKFSFERLQISSVPLFAFS